jgi:Chaperone of endosialidase
MADNNFVVKNGLTVNGSFTANSTVVNAAAVTATSVNAATLSISGSSVATLISSNAATAYTNAASYADTKSNAAYTNAVAIATNASNLSSGLVPTARLASGTASSSTYLRGDQTWASVSAGGSGTVTSVASGTGLVGGPITSSGTLSLASGVTTPATYSSGISSITVDTYGRVTSVSGGAGYVTSSGYGYNSSPTFDLITTNSITASSEIKGASLVTKNGAVYLNNALSVYMNWDLTNISFNRSISVTGGVTSSTGYYTSSNIQADGRYYGAGLSVPKLQASAGNVLYFYWNNADLVYDIDGGAQSRSIYYFGASDQRLKTNIANTQVDSLSIINSISLRKFDWTDEGLKYNNLKDEDRFVRIGVVAQELSEVIPEAVKIHKGERGDETQLLKGEAIIPYLIGAIQEQQKQIADLQAQINLLKK